MKQFVLRMAARTMEAWDPLEAGKSQYFQCLYKYQLANTMLHS